MKIRNMMLGFAISLCMAGTGWAQSTMMNSNSQINTQMNTGGSGNFGGNFGGFGNSSFSFSDGTTTLSQSTGADGSFCQFFSLSAGMNSIVQIMQGGSFSQFFGADVAAEDPCQ